MRGAFVDTLLELAEADDRIVLLTGDLGFMVIEPFAQRFPDRFVNVGVAEANMLGIAAGMAKQGLIPFCYSIATFATMRGYEQLRNGAVLHELPVRVVGVGGGFAYGSAGPTHWALEDIAIMRVQPGMTVIAPGTDAQTASALRSTYQAPGPVYYRLGKESTEIESLNGRFMVGRAEVLQSGPDALLITTGAMTAETVRAAGLLAALGIGATIVQIPCLAPAPIDDIVDAAAEHPLTVTIEDHYTVGGLGSLVAEVLAESAARSRLVRVGVPAQLSSPSGSERWMRKSCGLAAESIRDLVLRHADAPDWGRGSRFAVTGAAARPNRALVTTRTAQTAS